MKILVTGGAGFIGSHIVELFLAEGHEVAVFDNFSSGSRKNLPPNVTIFEGDIREEGMVATAFTQFRPEVVCHQAAHISVTHSVANPQHDASINIIGLLNVLQLSVKYAVKQILFASSGGAVYGEVTSQAKESDLPTPISPYGLSKLAGEKYIQYFSQTFGIHSVILRYANVYGPRQHMSKETGVITIFCQKLLHKEPVMIYGNGLSSRDYVYVADVAKANLKALKATKSDIFNVGTGISTTVNDLVSSLEKATGDTIEKKYLEERTGEIFRSCVDPHKIQHELGWSYDTDLNAGLKLTYEWYAQK